LTDFIIQEEVNAAIKSGRPVVAMESTVITHGLPFPENIKVAQELEQLCLECGVIPATITVFRGKIYIGTSLKMLTDLVQEPDLVKLSIRDLPVALAKKQSGGTTVASTLFCASLNKIQVFATGGIGGVHRGANLTFDISADLIALSQFPVIVVSAGAKAILDLPATLEYLETHSVPVIGYQTEDFPAFYSSHSGLKIEKADNAEQIARIFKFSQKINNNGILVANPVNQTDEIPAEIVNNLIENALLEAKDIRGKDITPFLLKKLSELSQGESVKTNLLLLKNNVRVACLIAQELTKLAD